MFHHSVYERGLVYFKQGRVNTLFYKKEDDYWIGKVIDTEMYYVTVELHEQFIDAKCDCLTSEQYGQCKHEVAVLLEMVKHRERIDNIHHEADPQKKRKNDQIPGHG